MSASEKKAERGEKRRQEEQKDRRTMALYSTVGIIVVVAAIAMMVWNSGLLQRNLTALDLNGTKYTAADLQYYYNNVYSSYANQYVFDSTTSVKRQPSGDESGSTWYDVLIDEAQTALTNNAQLAAKAEAEGFALTDESQAQLDSFIAQLNNAWISAGYASRSALIKANYGPYMTYDRLVELTRQQLLAADYAADRLESIEHSNADYETYYQEHAAELDTYVYSQFTFRAAVLTVDDEGNTIQLSDAEKAEQLETLKAEQKALAEEVQAKLEGGADPEAIAQEYEDEIYSSAVSRRTSGSNVSYSVYADWLQDSARRAGDVTLVEQEIGDTSFYYYVAVFESRTRDDENTHTVRHLLVRAGDGTADPTQEEYDEAETQAQALLDEWKAGEATEDSFAALVTANSADTASASNGGLISEITSTSSYVDAFRDWAVSTARREGDVELVKTEYGWHIMYYVSTDDPSWRLTALSALRQQDYEQLAAEAGEGWTNKSGFGMQLITP